MRSRGGYVTRGEERYGMEAVVVREFEAGDAEAFRRLNEEWIVKYFELEPKDEYVFANPEETILEKGGRIFFVEEGGKALGCCALLKIGEEEFEVGKMAVTESAKGRGLGRMVLVAAMEAARKSGAKRLFLETNSGLAPAIGLYESLGFRRLTAEERKPSAYARADVAMEMFL
jgi:ribosomal protein S18 acetylase RimI-like enzyme